MITLAVTGGTATGKTSFGALMVEMCGPALRLFDCDRAVHDLLTTPPVARTIAASLGQDLVDDAGRLDRSRLREIVFNDPDRRRTLEQILHPLVRRACLEARDEAQAAPEVRFFLADVPLLYESDFPLERDLDVVVACGPHTQRLRLAERNHFAPDLIERIIAAQLPVLDKVNRAHIVLWNGGSRDSLRRQTEQFIAWLKTSPSS